MSKQENWAETLAEESVDHGSDELAAVFQYLVSECSRLVRETPAQTGRSIRATIDDAIQQRFPVDDVR